MSTSHASLMRTHPAPPALQVVARGDAVCRERVCAEPGVARAPALAMEAVSHGYGDVAVLRGLDLVVRPGEIVCLVGPSGCGKTSSLRLAAGLEPLQNGSIAIDGRVVSGRGVHVLAEDRNVGLMFQDYALFPHMTVLDNVIFGVRRTGVAEKRERGRAVLADVGLAAYTDAYPHTLSGGQQQRVALARALAPRPKLMLLDEPFSGLDTQLRGQVRDDTMHLLKESGAATMLVTHDPEEAMFMGDRIAVMQHGRIVQVGSPVDIYCHPVNAFVAGFFSEVNRLQGVVAGGRVDTPLGQVQAPGLGEGTPVEVLIRPEAIRLAGISGDPGSRNRARVMASRMLGRSSLVHLSLAYSGGEAHLHARVPGRFLPAEGDLLAASLDSEQTFVFPIDPTI